MFLNDISLLLFIIHIICGVEPNEETSRSVHALGDGHGKPFGKGRPSTHVPVVSHSIMGKEFFSKYVSAQNPVVLKGLIKDSPAISLWSDDYFLNLENVPENHTVLIESNKKENRTDPPTFMSVRDFVKVYNRTAQYMVDTVPKYLRDDIQIPGVLQCPTITKAILEAMMWFSSGGTSSVVHTDAVDNLNCVIAGSKKFVLIPHKFKKLVTLDRPEGSYSDIDVDAVDYNKYPGLAEVEFQHAEIEAGDCLYIPYLLIHQVRSYNRSIAINFWWDSEQNENFNPEECNTVFDPSLRLSQATLLGLEHAPLTPKVFRDQLLATVEHEPVDFEHFIEAIDLLENFEDGEEESESFKNVIKHLNKAFEMLDTDSSGYIEISDIDNKTLEDWSVVLDMLTKALGMAKEKQHVDDRHDEL